MAAIQERKGRDGKPVYRVQIRMKGHPAQSATFSRKTDAKRWAAQTEAAIREGRHFATSEAKRHTLADLVDRYAREVLPQKKTKTQEPQRGQLAWWRASIGERVLSDVTPALVADCRDKLLSEPVAPKTDDPSKAGPERTRSTATVNRYLAILSHAFTVAVKEWGWVDSNPLLKVTKPKEPGGRVRYLDDDERDRLLSVCRESSNADLYPAVVLALSTGARQAEVMGLTWKRIDLAKGTALLDDTKNGERRVLPLAGPALALLKERAKVRRINTDLVFPSKVNPSKPIDLRSPWETALKRAEIEDFRWHDLRHSAASYLAMNGASLNEIAAVLGHKTLAMVKRYAHLSEAHTAGVVASMNARIFGEG
jgi:integrase